jgi:hypothetical protein
VRLSKLYKHAQQALLEKAAREARENELQLEEERREQEEKSAYQRQNSRRPSASNIQFQKAKDDAHGTKHPESFMKPSHPSGTGSSKRDESSGHVRI